MNEQQPNLDDWTDFLGKFLKVDHIDKFPCEVIVGDAEANLDKSGDAHLIFDVKFKDRLFKWEANKTNRDIIRDKGVESPKAAVGKKFIFTTHKVMNPSTKQMVDSLLVKDVK